MEASTPSRYSTTGQLIHWLTAIVVLLAFILGPGGPESRIYSASHDFSRQLHETLGLCVFALVVVRLLWRTVTVRPASPAVPRWMDLSAKLVQAALYLLLLALPLTAIAGAWLEGHPLTLMGDVLVAPMFAKAHAPGSVFAEVHGLLGDIILWLAGVHALAALYHHFMLKDGVMRSMLPRWFVSDQ